MGGTPSYEQPAIENGLEEDKKKAKKLRSALLETPGGIGGEEVMGGGTKERTTLFGN
jgi:hypothetical protein